MKKPPIFPAISTGFPKKIFVFWRCNLSLSPEIRQKFQFSAKIIHLFILKKIGSSSDSNLPSENSRIFFAYIQESDVFIPYTRSTFPERRHLEQTYTWQGVPFTTAFTRFTLGFHVLLERL